MHRQAELGAIASCIAFIGELHISNLEKFTHQDNIHKCTVDVMEAVRWTLPLIPRCA
jgi:hypothetical protein